MTILKKTFLLTALSAARLTTGCANRPESIAASYTSHERYMELDCTQLASTMSNARAELAVYADKHGCWRRVSYFNTTFSICW